MENLNSSVVRSKIDSCYWLNLPNNYCPQKHVVVLMDLEQYENLLKEKSAEAKEKTIAKSEEFFQKLWVGCFTWKDLTDLEKSIGYRFDPLNPAMYNNLDTRVAKAYWLLYRNYDNNRRSTFQPFKLTEFTGEWLNSWSNKRATIEIWLSELAQTDVVTECPECNNMNLDENGKCHFCCKNPTKFLGNGIAFSYEIGIGLAKR